MALNKLRKCHVCQGDAEWVTSCLGWRLRCNHRHKFIKCRNQTSEYDNMSDAIREWEEGFAIINKQKTMELFDVFS